MEDVELEFTYVWSNIFLLQLLLTIGAFRSNGSKSRVAKSSQVF